MQEIISGKINKALDITKKIDSLWLFDLLYSSFDSKKFRFFKVREISFFKQQKMKIKFQN